MQQPTYADHGVDLTTTPTLDTIEAALPQTQCGLCGYPGCKPYAEAILRGEAIHLCPPGGLKGLATLAALTHQSVTPLMQQALQTRLKTPVIAAIRPQECIGCTKCLQACPVDAIVGGPKSLHIILEDECTGCELCVAPCPVDCIDLVPVEQLQYDKSKAKNRYQAKLARGAFKRSDHLAQHSTATTTANIGDKKRFISDALARVKQKKVALQTAMHSLTAHSPVKVDHEKDA